MPLKADRVIIRDDITRKCLSPTLRGVVLMKVTAGSGVALGDSAGAADLLANPSGHKPAGLLLNDVVNIDQTRYHRNWHKDETMINERCRLLREGTVTTDQVATGVTPTDGETAYVTANGKLTNVPDTNGGVVATPKVGEFGGILDESGFITVNVQLPQL